MTLPAFAIGAITYAAELIMKHPDLAKRMLDGVVDLCDGPEIDTTVELERARAQASGFAALRSSIAGEVMRREAKKKTP